MIILLISIKPFNLKTLPLFSLIPVNLTAKNFWQTFSQNNFIAVERAYFRSAKNLVWGAKIGQLKILSTVNFNAFRTLYSSIAFEEFDDCQVESFLIAALIFSAGYYSAPIFFLQFKEFELYWGAVFFFFKICSHIFMIFEVKLE